MLQKLDKARVLVVGLGLSGRSAASFLLRRGAKVLAVDRSQEVLDNNQSVADLKAIGMQVCNECLFNLENLKHFNLIVVSPGIPKTNPIYQRASELGIEIIGEVELALREVSQRCVGITGTNGKTTVTLLVTHILNHSGVKAVALGNVGIPITAAIDKWSNNDAEVFVLELSSFQLETLKCRCLDFGVLLNITPDHLDRYDSMEDYALAKISILNCIKENGSIFVEDKCLEAFRPLFMSALTANISVSSVSYGYTSKCTIYSDSQKVYLNNFCSSTEARSILEKKQQFMLPSQYQNLQSHDIENIMAAFALCHSLNVPVQSFLDGLSTFKKPPHRIEFVRTYSEISYYDDSKGTNIDAVIRAVDSIQATGKIILIAGGVDKGFPYTSWLTAFDQKVKSICAIGQSAEKIKNDLGNSIPVILLETLELAVQHATDLASPGDAILLSPGCSSYDMFKDYVHRGKEFQRVVNNIGIGAPEK